MFKLGKITVPLLVAGFILSPVGGNVTAAELENESPTINWDDVWSSIDSNSNLSNSISFGSISTGSDISTFIWGNLADAKTTLSSGSGEVKSTGITKGKTLLTSTSATTSLRMSGMGIITGSKGVALGKFTATSEVSTTNPSGLQSWEGLTIHTATDSGTLYESKTYDYGSY